VLRSTYTPTGFDANRYPSATIITLRMLIRHATPFHRWDDRPTTKGLK
jgi:hypothetical protein